MNGNPQDLQGRHHPALDWVYLAPSELPILFYPKPRAVRWPSARVGPGLDYDGFSGQNVGTSHHYATFEFTQERSVLHTAKA